MRGISKFNFPAFFEAAAQLRDAGHEVFNPAERDVNTYGPGVMASATGDLADIAHLGFSIRDAMSACSGWICRHADGIAMLPGWEHSRGATAEKALAEALGLEVRYL